MSPNNVNSYQHYSNKSEHAPLTIDDRLDSNDSDGIEVIGVGRSSIHHQNQASDAKQEHTLSFKSHVILHTCAVIIILVVMITALFIHQDQEDGDVISSGQIQNVSSNLIWSDEFDGDSIDLGKWTFVNEDGCQFGLCGWGKCSMNYLMCYL